MNISNYGTKLVIYWLVIIGYLFLPRLVISIIPPFIFTIIAVGAIIWMISETSKESKRINVNENWWVAVFLFGPVGATFYYFSTNEKRKVAKPLEPALVQKKPLPVKWIIIVVIILGVVIAGWQLIQPDIMTKTVWDCVDRYEAVGGDCSDIYTIGCIYRGLEEEGYPLAGNEDEICEQYMMSCGGLSASNIELAMLKVQCKMMIAGHLEQDRNQLLIDNGTIPSLAAICDNGEIANLSCYGDSIIGVCGEEILGSVKTCTNNTVVQNGYYKSYCENVKCKARIVCNEGYSLVGEKCELTPEGGSDSSDSEEDQDEEFVAPPGAVCTLGDVASQYCYGESSIIQTRCMNWEWMQVVYACSHIVEDIVIENGDSVPYCENDECKTRIVCDEGYSLVGEQCEAN